MKKIISFLNVFIVLLPMTAFAYTDTNILGTMLADVNPKYPEPGKQVTITLKSYASDLNRAMIEWFINNKTQKAGTGMTAFSATMSKAGEEVRIAAKASTPEGDIYAKELVFMPASVELMWQANTYVPNYYKGRALPTAGSDIMVSADPYLVEKAGAKIPAVSLNYEWTRKGEPDKTASGYGKSKYILSSLSEYNNDSVGVTVSSLDGLVMASKSVTIPTMVPKVLIYEERPLGGTAFANALSNNFDMLVAEIVLRAEPFFYPLNSRNFYAAWAVNGEATMTDASNPNLLTLREETGQAGTAIVVFSAGNSQNSGQSTSAGLNIKFGNLNVNF